LSTRCRRRADNAIRIHAYRFEHHRDIPDRDRDHLHRPVSDEASIIGWLLQTKALIMIIFITILMDKGLITSKAFTSLLLIAVASTMLTVPVVSPKLQRMRSVITQAA
jgi:hypothetical protein